MAKKKTSRPEPTPRTKLMVWAASAGRCVLCNRIVYENEDLGELVPIGELAHNVGWSSDSPRGDSDLTEEERREAANLLLLCRNCHKPVDDGGVIGRFTVQELARFKREHEDRIRLATGVGADRKAALIRVVGTIRGSQPELTYDTVQYAAITSGVFPKRLPGCYINEYEIDLRQLPNPGTAEYFQQCATAIDAFFERVNDGIRQDKILRLAVFAFARIPVLVHLGSRLDDKVEALIFQRQRLDGGNAWRWPETAGAPPQFEVSTLTSDRDIDRVALIVNLSGTVALDDLPEEQRATFNHYAIQPVSPASPSPNLINSQQALSNFEHTVRQFLAQIEADHGRISEIALFGAVPISAAIVLGRVLMPGVSPAWLVFDRDDQGTFTEACEVRR